jgi:hypothetical protein
MATIHIKFELTLFVMCRILKSGKHFRGWGTAVWTDSLASPFVCVCGKTHVIALVVSCTYSPWNGSTCAVNIVGLHYVSCHWKQCGARFVKRVIYILCWTFLFTVLIWSGFCVFECASTAYIYTVIRRRRIAVYVRYSRPALELASLFRVFPRVMSHGCC